MTKKDEKLRKDIFILIIGHGRTGTSLCVGLLNSSPRFNVGYEINNQWINSEDQIDQFDLPLFVEESLLRKEQTISKEYNGNKVVIHRNTSLDILKACCKNGLYVIHNDYKELKVIFTRRKIVDTIISKYMRVREKGKYFSIEKIVEDYSVVEKMIKKSKKIFKDHYVFNFDQVLKDNSRAARLFDFVGEEFFESYVSDYEGVGNYSHARGVSSNNVLFGKEELFPKLRKEVRKILNKKGLIRKILNKKGLI